MVGAGLKPAPDPSKRRIKLSVAGAHRIMLRFVAVPVDVALRAGFKPAPTVTHLNINLAIRSNQ